MSSDGSVEAFERIQKEAFGREIQDWIVKRGIQFIGEETRHGDESVVQRVCAIANIKYANVEMSPEERQQRGIPPNYSDDEAISDEHKGEYHRIREEYMCRTALRNARDAASIAIICGREHSGAIAAEFRRLGHEVTVTDIRTTEWYIENWAEHCMNM